MHEQYTHNGETPISEAVDTKPTPEEIKQRYLWGLRYDSLYHAQFSVIYHRKRERFFDAIDRSSKATMILFGSAAFASVDGSEWFGLSVAVVASLSLVFDYSVKARQHADLARRFLEIEADIVSHGERDFNEEDLKQWKMQLVLAEADEPPTIRALAELCQAELDKSLGFKRHVNWLKQLTANFGFG